MRFEYRVSALTQLDVGRVQGRAYMYVYTLHSSVSFSVFLSPSLFSLKFFPAYVSIFRETIEVEKFCCDHLASIFLGIFVRNVPQSGGSCLEVCTDRGRGN